ncbi:hypothetical protein Ahy_B04g072347 [Arachis hypogaea]|uniref:Uncharacterized protein n=1 Tax=Arachis hypogaea TaxID=3818 RepID=A0A444ZN64_ARAHY|nr:hypothetical protein Ahy_B04g072347 [Arachis hypogaea]
MVDKALIKFWYKLDSTFKVPRANTYFRINLKGVYANAQSCVLSELFILLLKNELNEIIYQASTYCKVRNFYLLCWRQTGTESYKRRHEENFEEYQHEAFKSFVIFEIASFVPSFYDTDEKLHHINDLFLDDLIAFIPELRSKLYFEQDLGLGSIKLKALIDLFEEVDEVLFNKLRTKEQLGYVVECSLRLTYRIFGFCFYVQSSEYDPIYVQDTIDNFIDGVEEMLKEAKELKNTSKQDVVEWYWTYFRQPSPKCQRLLIPLWGYNTKFEDDVALPETVQAIKDPGSFKMSCEFYPNPC